MKFEIDCRMSNVAPEQIGYTCAAPEPSEADFAAGMECVTVRVYSFCALLVVHLVWPCVARAY